MNELLVPSAAQCQFDIREDEEQYVKLAESLDLLISAGYFRAQIQGLSSFDKIVGGMVWCISLCAQSIDVDLLYSENSTIGKKISLTERIVEVLPRLKCPHSLEPHQIQGLDCIHIFPIIQWLVKEAKLAKAKCGDEQQNFSVYQFEQEKWNVKDEPKSDVRPVVKSRKVYKRMIRMKPTVFRQHESQLTNEGIDNTAEAEDTSLEAESMRALVVCEDGDYSTTENVSSNLLIAYSPRNSEQEDVDAEKLDASQLSILNEEEQLLSAEVNEEQMKYDKLIAEAETIETQINEYNAALESVDPEVILSLKSLLIERDEIKGDESSFKRECRKQLEDLDSHIEKLKQKEAYPDSVKANVLDNEMDLLKDRLNSAMSQLFTLNTEIFKLEREVEKHPSQIELNQYQRRFLELYNQMSSKHRETKRYYTLYNTLFDIRNFVKREIDLLNSIDDSKNLALNDGYKDSFVENLQNICKSVEQSLDKILCGKKTLQDQRDSLADNLQLLVDKQRLYMKTVAEFQAECQKNEQLRAILESRS